MRLPIAVSRYKSIGASRAANIATFASSVSQFPFSNQPFLSRPPSSSSPETAREVKYSAQFSRRTALIKRAAIINGAGQNRRGESGGKLKICIKLSACFIIRNEVNDTLRKVMSGILVVDRDPRDHLPPSPSSACAKKSVNEQRFENPPGGLHHSCNILALLISSRQACPPRSPLIYSAGVFYFSQGS